MEINARVYAVSADKRLLEEIRAVLKTKTLYDFFSVVTMEPCAVLPLERTWFGMSGREEPADGPEEWLPCLQECSRILGKNGAVVVEFWSPDAPDDYPKYAYTKAGGGAGRGSRPGLAGYTRALRNQDAAAAVNELLSGRTAWDRERLCRRIEKKEAIRREKGDFEITPDGVLKRYRGRDKNVVIPDGVREIGSSAFVDLKGVERMLLEDEEYDAPEMEMLVFPDSLEKIGDYAFAYCMNLKSVQIPDSVRFIGDRAFEGCESLKEIRLPAGLREIEENTFFLCEKLRHIEIPESVTRIGSYAFSCCDLRRITLPEGLVSIGDEAFYGCRFWKVRIPESVTEIGKNVFPKGTQVYRAGEKESDALAAGEEDEDDGGEDEYESVEDEEFDEEWDPDDEADW